MILILCSPRSLSSGFRLSGILYALIIESRVVMQSSIRQVTLLLHSSFVYNDGYGEVHPGNCHNYGLDNGNVNIIEYYKASIILHRRRALKVI